MNKADNVLISSQITVDDREKFKQVAKHTGVSMNAQLRLWIRDHYNKLPKEAK